MRGRRCRRAAVRSRWEAARGGAARGGAGIRVGTGPTKSDARQSGDRKSQTQYPPVHGPLWSDLDPGWPRDGAGGESAWRVGGEPVHPKSSPTTRSIVAQPPQGGSPFARPPSPSAGPALQKASEGDPTVIVAVIAARMVKVIAHEVVHVIAMRDRIVPARRPVPVRPLVRRTCVVRGALRRVRRSHRQAVLVDMPSVRVVQVTVIQVIAVAVVLDGFVPTGIAMNVRMVRVNGVVHGPRLTRVRIGSSVLSLGEPTLSTRMSFTHARRRCGARQRKAQPRGSGRIDPIIAGDSRRCTARRRSDRPAGNTLRHNAGSPHRRLPRPYTRSREAPPPRFRRRWLSP